MIIKKYEVADMKDAIPTIRKDLGENAIILGTRRVNRNSVMGLLSRPMIEVTAAVDSPLTTRRNNLNNTRTPNTTPRNNRDNHDYNNNNGGNPHGGNPSMGNPNGNSNMGGSNMGGSNTMPTPPPNYTHPTPTYGYGVPYHYSTPHITPPAPLPVASVAYTVPGVGVPLSSVPLSPTPFASAINSIGLEQFENLLSEITQIKNELHSLRSSSTHDVAGVVCGSGDVHGSGVDSSSGVKLAAEFSWSRDTSVESESLRPITSPIAPPRLTNPALVSMMDLMISSGIHEEVVWRYLGSMDAMNLEHLSSGQLQNLILECITHLVPIKNDYYTNPQNRVIALVGPTGVGKTTTIAKMAATLSLKMQKKVALITIDNFRIGAVDQLRTYADIVNAPIYVASNTAELQHAFDECRHMDHVLIDSMGRGQFDHDEIASIRSVLGDSSEMDIAMVMSMSSNHAEMEDVFKSYRVLDPNYVIFTKLDETRHFAPLLNIPTRYNTPLLFLSTGQNVPDDIEVPDITKITSNILSNDRLLWSNS